MANVITMLRMKAGTLVKPLDIVVIVLSAVLTLAVGSLVYSGGNSSSRVVIRGPDRTWVFPLEAETLVDVPGPMGETRVRIHNGEAAIVSSPCGGQTCVSAGGLHRNGQWAACLPNQVIVLVEGAHDEDAIDAASW